MTYTDVLLTIVVIAALLALAAAFVWLLRNRAVDRPSPPEPRSTAPEVRAPRPVASSRDNGRRGVTILHGRESLTAAYEELRTRDHLSRVLAVWSADYGEIAEYFQEERDWLERNPAVMVDRIVIAQASQHAFLAELADQHDNLRLFTSNTKDFEFELYICVYNRPNEVESSAGILVVNNMFSRRPEFGVMLDAQDAPELVPFVSTLQTWFDKLPRTVVEGHRGAEDVWTKNAALYDEYVSRDSSLLFLRDFIRSEDDYITQLVRRSLNDVSLVEFGSGTGRTIHYLASLDEVVGKVTYFIGFDHASGMIRESQSKRRASTAAAAAKTFFFTLDGANAIDSFWGGRITLNENLQDLDHLDANPCEPDVYAASDKIFCCLLNTLGVLDKNTRAEFVTNMFLAATPSDTVVISVFASEAFVAHAPEVYTAIEPLVDAPVTDGAFDYDVAEFRAGSYFSHWLSEQELEELVVAGGGRVVEMRAIRSQDGERIGHIAVCDKTAKGPSRTTR